ncbi:HD-GYP domain-containing protein [Phycicoccus sonneratiae]|uniref:HD domain-containing protein n=1 Tax=Phycicoccus sonneratiae TaxID=2807628 RepID=A0ABS2CLF5_9MICO|nr:HD domain-containing phosphohydrolase [Phycicoccus sonneraticus]MBM6400694.1 HD domain-containing protein [Phycicoccus sonneraticus]
MKGRREGVGPHAATTIYLVVLAVGAVLLAGFSSRVHPISVGPDLIAVLALAVLAVAYPGVVVGDRVHLAISSIVMLAAQAVVGPAVVALAGALIGPFQGSSWQGRLFNSAQFSIFGCVGGLAFLAAGGTLDPAELAGVTPVVVHLALPMVVADLVQVLANAVLLSGMMRVARGVPVRLHIGLLLRSTGAAAAGYGVIAFILVVLWVPAQLGVVVATAMVLAPLLVAHWAYRQHADELQGQQRVLGVLVAAVEAKAPHLTGHSARVADLSGRMAEHLGLTPQQVADTRIAGMLHDVGQTTLPTREARGLDLTDPASTTVGYPRAGVAILGDLTFLRGALDSIETHRRALADDAAASLPSRIVALADLYDLLTQVGTPGGTVYAPSQARDLIATEHPGPRTEELVRALDVALTRAEELST